RSKHMAINPYQPAEKTAEHNTAPKKHIHGRPVTRQQHSRARARPQHRHDPPQPSTPSNSAARGTRTWPGADRTAAS
ncbi:hypothetical protein LXA20_17660, partial [Erwinia amylovora]|uniref:hypothetical protein n=1 Tax=Erwinia amylovora TaxID=552 RepID=UPI0020C078F2